MSEVQPEMILLPPEAIMHVAFCTGQICSFFFAETMLQASCWLPGNVLLRPACLDWRESSLPRKKEKRSLGLDLTFAGSRKSVLNFLKPVVYGDFLLQILKSDFDQDVLSSGVFGRGAGRAFLVASELAKVLFLVKSCFRWYRCRRAYIRAPYL
ncbi:hypothetical protein RvY_05173-2 [Ramazzottius varieornatus]|uniref:Uncharacterized protein n=1 Tax=Ramazzottius varieornatus TaxID=947166 RepID=A0A1D1UX82_RAMVA|nr:hypothetical protein RvY_05173-2 [Ramazzottius varieornatus]